MEKSSAKKQGTMKGLAERVLMTLAMFLTFICLSTDTTTVFAEDTKVTEIDINYNTSNAILNTAFTYRQWDEAFQATATVTTEGTKLDYITNNHLEYILIGNSGGSFFESPHSYEPRLKIDDNIDPEKVHYLLCSFYLKEGFCFDTDNLTDIKLKLNGTEITMKQRVDENTLEEAIESHAAYLSSNAYSTNSKRLDIHIPLSYDSSYVYEKVNVTYAANGGTGTMAVKEMAKGGTLILPDCEFTPPTGKNFKCWEVNGEQKSKGSRVTISQDTEIKAIWAGELYTLTVKNGTTVNEIYQFEFGETVEIIANTPAESQYFDGWTSTDSVSFADSKAKSTSFIMPAKKVTVTAEMKYRTDINTLTVTLSKKEYDYSGNENIPEITIKDGSDTLQENIDYTLEYMNTIEVGKASVVVTGIGRYRSTQTVYYEIYGYVSEIHFYPPHLTIGKAFPEKMYISTVPAAASNGYVDVKWLESADGTFLNATPLSSAVVEADKAYTFKVEDIYKDYYKSNTDIKFYLSDKKIDQTNPDSMMITPHELKHCPAAEPTCTSSGAGEYWFCEKCGKYFSDEEGKNEIEKDSWIIKSPGHDYDTPVYTWSDDGKLCTAKAVCKKDPSHVITENAAVTSAVKTSSTKDSMGVTTYTATFTDPVFTTQTKDITDIPKKSSGGGSTGGGGGSSSGGGGGSTGGGGGSSSGGATEPVDQTKATDNKTDGNKKSEVVKENPDGSTTTTVITENTDGSSTVTETTKNTDGSFTVTETTKNTDGSSVRTETTQNTDGTTVKLDITTPAGKNGTAKQTYELGYVSAKGSELKIVMEAGSNGALSIMSVESDDGKVAIPDSVKTSEGEVIITALGKNAFKGNKKITEVTIGKNIKLIGANAFKKAKNLKKLTIAAGKDITISKGAFKGISKKAVISIKADKKTYKKLVKAIKKSGAPDTVKFKRIKK